MLLAFVAYLPFDALAYVLLALIAYATDVERIRRALDLSASALRAELASSRLSALRAQLRPHFFLNALNSAAVLARRGDAPAAADMLAELGDLLRYVVRETSENVTLGEELDFATRYLGVEQVRFADRLRPSIDASADVRRAMVPPLLIQPLVENAVRHGVAKRQVAGVIQVKAWRNAGTLHITIEDDGPGPDAPNDEPPGIGLANTRSRLAAMFG